MQGQPMAPCTRRWFSSTRLTVWADQSLNLPQSLVRIRDDSNRFLSDIANVVLLVTEGDHGLPDFHRRRSSPIWKTKHEVHGRLLPLGRVDKVLQRHTVVSFADGLYMTTIDGRHPSRVGLARRQ